MKKWVCTIIIFFIAISITGCGTGHEDDAKTPSASSAQKGRNYQEVIDTFKDQGFTNIKTKTVEDLSIGWLIKDGEVESVSVDGNADYSPDTWYAKNVDVVITYHTFPNTEEKTTTDPSSPTYYNNTKNVTGNSEEDTMYARRRAALKAAENQTDIVLTADNNTELAALLELMDPGDSSINEFALNYYGWTIEFDGNIAEAINITNSNTLYDCLVSSKDYSTTEQYGPNFQFKNVSSTRYPDAITSGKNVHIKATVGAFDKNSELFELTPLSVTAR